MKRQCCSLFPTKYEGEEEHPHGDFKGSVNLFFQVETADHYYNQPCCGHAEFDVDTWLAAAIFISWKGMSNGLSCRKWLKTTPACEQEVFDCTQIRAKNPIVLQALIGSKR